MNRFVLACALLPALAACQEDDSRYDAAAKAKARAVAPKVAWSGYGQVVSVGPPKERTECSEASPFRAGRCLDVLVTSRMPVLDGSGTDTAVDAHVYVWLERKADRWVVRATDYWSDHVRVTIRGAPYASPWALPPSP